MSHRTYMKGIKKMNLPNGTKEALTKNVRADIANLMGFIECELDKYPEVLNWAQVGDLNRLKDNLTEALHGLSGFSIGDIKETIEDARQ
jgi:hypothetical protein